MVEKNRKKYVFANLVYNNSRSTDCLTIEKPSLEVALTTLATFKLTVNFRLLSLLYSFQFRSAFPPLIPNFTFNQSIASISEPVIM